MAVVVGIFLIGVGVIAAVVHIATDAVAVGVVVRIVRTGIAGIALAVVVGIFLTGVGAIGTVVHIAEDPIPVNVTVRIIVIHQLIAVVVYPICARLSGTRVDRGVGVVTVIRPGTVVSPHDSPPYFVAIAICVSAIVTGVARSIPVGILLVRVYDVWAVVAGVAHAIPCRPLVDIPLGRVRVVRAVVHIAAPAVAIGVVVRVVGASVADITNAIAVGILLARVWAVRAVVRIAAHAVYIGVGASLAGITNAIAVGILLARVSRVGAVVAAVAHAIAIGILLARI